MAKKALIMGVSGQDGAYLAQLLLEQGYLVVGTSRDAASNPFANLDYLGIKDRVKLISMATSDPNNVHATLNDVRPDEIYNLAGQSSVGLSFEQPVETINSISVANLNLLEAIRISDFSPKLYNAGSSDCFGNTNGLAADELTPFQPRSPYAVAKAAAFWQVSNYREAYGMFCCSGILFNHESPLRPQRFVTQKIIQGAIDIKEGRAEKLTLGDMSLKRDWGWAPEFVHAMWLMMQQPYPEDYVIATGTSHTIEEFVDIAFDRVGLNYRDHVESSDRFRRPTDIAESHANPDKAMVQLGWTAKVNLAQVIGLMIDDAYAKSRMQSGSS